MQRSRTPKRSAPRHDAGLLASLLTLAIIGCLTLAPETIASGERDEVAVVGVEDSASTGPIAATPGADGVQVRHLVAKGETFASILRDRGLPAVEILAWRQAAVGTYDLAHVRPGHAFVFTFTRDQGRLMACDYEIDAHSLLALRLMHGQIRAQLKAMPRLAAVRGIAGQVESSLATSATAVGVPLRMVSELADLFGWELDFESDVRPGDEFRLIYAELREEEGGRARPGDILAAEITSGGQTLTAIRFENERGGREYYDLDGRALGRRFLKYPVEFTAISSSYATSRLHPVLKRRRPHRGIDFAAPLGTPVRAVASGVITFAGRNGQYGNQVDVDHGPPYASSYSHLHRFARGVRRGTSVRKGQVIGYVGRTGMATGPHLHYMLFRAGTYVNPLTVQLSADEQITGARWTRFARLRDDLIDRLANLGKTMQLETLSLAPVSLADKLRSGAASYVN